MNALGCEKRSFMIDNFFRDNEDAMLRAAHPSYNEYCRDDDGEDDEWVYDRMEEADRLYEEYRDQASLYE